MDKIETKQEDLRYIFVAVNKMITELEKLGFELKTNKQENYTDYKFFKNHDAKHIEWLGCETIYENIDITVYSDNTMTIDQSFWHGYGFIIDRIYYPYLDSFLEKRKDIKIPFIGYQPDSKIYWTSSFNEEAYPNNLDVIKRRIRLDMVKEEKFLTMQDLEP